MIRIEKPRINWKGIRFAMSAILLCVRERCNGVAVALACTEQLLAAVILSAAKNPGSCTFDELRRSFLVRRLTDSSG
ncbi:hypothetical protein SBA2_270067 [Acidobacteriia bacterium SbA2]|nr:hypothetical protein SBA2_270067 [Acidobacteriia bacterium SbA2]